MKREEAKQKLEEMAKEAQQLGKPGNKLGGAGSDQEGEPIEANLKNQLKTKELQLEQFKKYRGDKEFLRENNFTEDEYEQFLSQLDERVKQLREDVASGKTEPSQPRGPVTLGNNDASTERLKGRTEAGNLSGVGGASVAPPGFAEAQKRFAIEAAKREAERAKQNPK
jgi:hypothetical protein